MRWNILFIVLAAVLFSNGADAIMCHRCYSAMGGCGKDLVWWMFPWKPCKNSRFCVKIIEKVGSDYTIIRECEDKLLKSTKHRLQMPGIRRNGYCEYARKNLPSDPSYNEDKKVKYCFCDDWDGCNSGRGLSIRVLPVALVAVLVTFLTSKIF